MNLSGLECETFVHFEGIKGLKWVDLE